MSEYRPSSRTPADDLTVIPYRPHRERNLILLAVLAVLVAALISWAWGRAQGEGRAQRSAEELRLLAERHAALLAEHEALGRALADAEVNERVGVGFDEHVRTTLVEQSKRINALEDEVRIYRSIIAADDDEGVQIARLELIERIDGRGVRFRLLLVQSTDQRSEVHGEVELSLVGERNGNSEVLEVDSVGEGAYPMPFRFRYFQNLVGEIELPEGFHPEGVQVVAREAGPDGFLLERTFSWQIQEA